MCWPCGRGYCGFRKWRIKACKGDVGGSLFINMWVCGIREATSSSIWIASAVADFIWNARCRIYLLLTKRSFHCSEQTHARCVFTFKCLYPMFARASVSGHEHVRVRARVCAHGNNHGEKLKLINYLSTTWPCMHTRARTSAHTCTLVHFKLKLQPNG